MASIFYTGAPDNLGDLMAQIARFYGWSKNDVEDLTLEELCEWAVRARRMVAKDNKGGR